MVATASSVSARPLGFKGVSSSYPPGRSWRTSFSISPNKVDIAASSNLGRKGRLPFYTRPSSPYHQSRPALGLPGKLLVRRIAVANPDYSSNVVRLIDAGAVHGIVIENYHVAPTRRGGHSIFKIPSVVGQIGLAGSAILILFNLRQPAVFVRTP